MQKLERGDIVEINPAYRRRVQGNRYGVVSRVIDGSMPRAEVTVPLANGMRLRTEFMVIDLCPRNPEDVKL